MTNSKHIIKTYLAICLLSLFVVGTSFADDGLTPGPGLFSGETGEFSLAGVFAKLTKQRRAESSSEQQLEAVQPGTTASTAELSADFAKYKEWKALHEQNPQLYQSFDLWLEYQADLQSSSDR